MTLEAAVYEYASPQSRCDQRNVHKSLYSRSADTDSKRTPFRATASSSNDGNHGGGHRTRETLDPRVPHGGFDWVVVRSGPTATNVITKKGSRVCLAQGLLVGRRPELVIWRVLGPVYRGESEAEKPCLTEISMVRVRSVSVCVWGEDPSISTPNDCVSERFMRYSSGANMSRSVRILVGFHRGHSKRMEQLHGP